MKLPHHDGYDPNCDGCKPAIINYRTGRPYAKDHPMVVAATRVLEQATKAEQDAYIRVCVNNSRKLSDMELAQAVVRRMQAAMMITVN